MKAGKPLQRKTPLTAKTLMNRGKGLQAGGSGLKRAAAKKPKRPAGTGPSAAVRKAVMLRDQETCVVCGVIVTDRVRSIHHRRNRGMGGSSDPRINDVTNLVVACGDGTSGCHGLLTERPWELDAEKHGWIIGRNSIADPALVPVLVAWLGWCLPTSAGEWQRIEAP
ncbi:HNH endonuclease [Streptosporangium sp. NPDC050855]|uniref:HNH endonuclease n=1 Tax=Streptosporangium sp. NPDC050855 TaxID=3366194 RepID=UPI0037AB51E2